MLDQLLHAVEDLFGHGAIHAITAAAYWLPVVFALVVLVIAVRVGLWFIGRTAEAPPIDEDFYRAKGWTDDEIYG